MRAPFVVHLLLLAAAIAPVCARAPAQCEEARLAPTPPVGASQFGRALALDGDVAIVGAPLENHPGKPGAGAAYVFRRTGGAWAQEARLVSADAASGDQLGRSVAIRGDVAIVGAPMDDDFLAGADSGSAYVFRRSVAGVWTQEARLIAIESGPGDQFGFAVAFDGVFALIGAPNHDTNGFDAGAAYLFAPGAPGLWNEETQLLAPDGQLGDQYGRSVSVSGQYFLIGAPRSNYWGPASGAAYFGRRVVAGLVIADGKVAPEAGASNEEFGASVSLRGFTALIGAPLVNDGATDTGAAFVFRRIGMLSIPWLQEARLTATTQGGADQFGQSVAIETDAALIGSGMTGAADAGRAQVFLRRPSGLWQAWSVLEPADIGAGDEFGAAVALEGERGGVGGRFLNWSAPDAGGCMLVAVGRRAGDTDGDGSVDFIDLNNVLSDYGQFGSGLAGDVNADGLVDFVDLNIVLGEFGAAC